MNLVKRISFILLLFSFFHPSLKGEVDETQRLFLPGDLLIIGFDKEINEVGDDQIVLRNLVALHSEDQFEISNSQYETGNIWNRNFPKFIAYTLTYHGIKPIEKNSIISIQTQSNQSTDNWLKILVNGVDFTEHYEVQRTAAIEKNSNDLLTTETEESIYLLQGSFYTQTGATHFLGSVIHGISFSDDSNFSAFAESVNLGNAGVNVGRGDGGTCDPCVTISIIGDVSNWTTQTGTKGGDLGGYPTDLPTSCTCQGDIIIQDLECQIDVSENSSFICKQGFSYEWVLMLDSGLEVILNSGVFYGAIGDLPLLVVSTPGAVRLKVFCGDCVKESNEMPVYYCGGGEDREGNVELMEVKQVLKIYPNPASDNFQIELEGEEKGNWILSVYAANGRTQLDTPLSVKVGINQFSIDSSHFPSGVYFVQLINGEKVMEWNYLTIAR